MERRIKVNTLKHYQEITKRDGFELEHDSNLSESVIGIIERNWDYFEPVWTFVPLEIEGGFIYYGK